MVRLSDYQANFHRSTSSTHIQTIDNYSDKLRVAMSRLRLCPPRDSPQNNIFQYKETDTCSHVFFAKNRNCTASNRPLRRPIQGHRKERHSHENPDKGKVETVSLDRVKPAHLDSKPETGRPTEKKPKTQNNTMNSKNTAIVRRVPALNQNSDRRRAEPKVKTQTRSDAVENGTNLATISQHNANRVNLPKQFTPYVAPHSPTPTAFHANRSSGGLRTYSPVPLHLRGKTPNSKNTTKTSNVKNNSNIADGDQIVPDTTVKQTRAGRKIHTSACFVQMIHALVAPNDIYCGTNCTNRNNHNL